MATGTDIAEFHLDGAPAGRDPKFPFYHLVPKSRRENIKFRGAMRKFGAGDRANARMLWVACSRDILFWINTFVYAFDPRIVDGDPRGPFITYPYQDDAFHTLLDCFGKEDVLIEKSRDMGASWMILLLFYWDWCFHPGVAFTCVSRKEDLVDKAGDPDSLFWKLEWVMKCSPAWLVPAFERKKLHLRNEDNASVIDGESTTGDVTVGGRRKAILLDEFSRVKEGYEVLSGTRDVTRCRIFNSTPKGTANAFYALKEGGKIRKLRFHWTQHPVKSNGMYVDESGRERSPWYDEECRRAHHPMEIAQELDIDYLASDFEFFPPALVQEIMDRDVKPEYQTGAIQADGDRMRFEDDLRGSWKFWTFVDGLGRVPDSKAYAIGVDVAMGTEGEHASNSVISVADRQTGLKVAEFASNAVAPHALAREAEKAAKLFNNAYVIWEANGPGELFGRTLVSTGYRDVYYRRDERRLSRKSSDKPGWWSTRESKLTLLGEYKQALADGTFTNRSREAVDECRFYIYTKHGTVAHAKSIDGIDPSQTKQNHGDRVIADALCLKGVREAGPVRTRKYEALPGSFLRRRLDALRDRNRKRRWAV